MSFYYISLVTYFVDAKMAL